MSVRRGLRSQKRVTCISAVWVTVISVFQQWVLVCFLLHMPVFPDTLCGCRGLYLPHPKQRVCLILNRGSFSTCLYFYSPYCEASHFVPGEKQLFYIIISNELQNKKNFNFCFDGLTVISYQKVLLNNKQSRTY